MILRKLEELVTDANKERIEEELLAKMQEQRSTDNLIGYTITRKKLGKNGGEDLGAQSSLE